MHLPKLALVGSAFSRYGRGRSMGVFLERQVLKDPHDLTGADKLFIYRWLRFQGVALAGIALEIGELDHHQLGVRVAFICIAGHGEAWPLRVGGQALGVGPEGQFRRFGLFLPLALGRRLASRQGV